jgi:hypothetical protein
VARSRGGSRAALRRSAARGACGDVLARAVAGELDAIDSEWRTMWAEAQELSSLEMTGAAEVSRALTKAALLCMKDGDVATAVAARRARGTDARVGVLLNLVRQRVALVRSRRSAPRSAAAPSPLCALREAPTDGPPPLSLSPFGLSRARTPPRSLPPLPRSLARYARTRAAPQLTYLQTSVAAMLDLQESFAQPLLFAASTGKVDAETSSRLVRDEGGVEGPASPGGDASGIASNVAGLRAGRGVRTLFAQSSSSITASDLSSGLVKMAAKKGKVMISKARGSIMQMSLGAFGGGADDAASRAELLVRTLEHADVKVVLTCVTQMITLEVKLLSDIVDATDIASSKDSRKVSCLYVPLHFTRILLTV